MSVHKGHVDAGEAVEQVEGDGRLRRRGVIAGTAALVAGLLAKRAVQPVEAYGTPPLNLATSNYADYHTSLFPTVPTPTNYASPFFLIDISSIPDGVDVDAFKSVGKGQYSGVLGFGGNNSGTGTYGQGGGPNGVGIKGLGAGAGPGVQGLGNGTGGAGVVGTGGSGNADGVKGYGRGTYSGTAGFGGDASGPGAYGMGGSPNGPGVKGQGTGSGPGVLGFGGPVGTGVKGVSTNNVTGETGSGVYGENYAGGQAIGVLGKSGSGYGLYGLVGDFGYGVAGVATNYFGVYGGATSGYGVYGHATLGNGVYGDTQGTGVVAGVYGTSATAYGIIGNTTAAGYSGLTAITSTAGVAALAATSTVNTAYAAYFQGTTVVQGDFFVVAGAKSAVVPHADGSHRAVYCVESPESWFEDFGKGKLVGGKADITLDADFASIVHADDYLVFLTTGGDFHAHVAQQTAAGFAVRQTTGTGSAGASGSFSYRVVAKRKDIAAKRLAKVDLPKINTPDPAKLPKPLPPKNS